MKTTIEKFEKCKKEGLIKTLWRNHSNEPKVLPLLLLLIGSSPLVLYLNTCTLLVQVLLSVTIFTCTVEPPHSGHHWDHSKCPD